MDLIKSAISNFKENGFDKKLKSLAKETLTKEEVKAQRISYVYGNQPKNSRLSKKDVTKIINKYDGQ